MCKVSSVLFDLDGTLLDTLDDLAAAVNHALCAVGLPRRTRPEVRAFLGNGIRALMRRAVGESCSDEMAGRAFEAFRLHYLAHCMERTRPFDGVPALLGRLRAAGVATAIVSNKADEAVQLLRRRFFDGQIEVAVGESATVRRKPSPDAIFRALELVGCPPAEAVYVGDSEVDLEAARNAGIPCVTVLWGFRDEPFLRQAGATRLVRTPAELARLLLGEASAQASPDCKIF